MMQWFGKHWGAAICADTPPVATPVGAPCDWCKEVIDVGDDGVMQRHYATSANAAYSVAFHRECFERLALGGINHQRGRCSCCGGDQPPDPPGLPRRTAARIAVAWATFLTDQPGCEP